VAIFRAGAAVQSGNEFLPHLPGHLLGIVAICGIPFLLGKGLFRICKWLEKKTGNSTLAYGAEPLVLMALFYAAYGAWMLELNKGH
jgi:hypothetical protein